MEETTINDTRFYIKFAREGGNRTMKWWGIFLVVSGVAFTAFSTWYLATHTDGLWWVITAFLFMVAFSCLLTLRGERRKVGNSWKDEKK